MTTDPEKSTRLCRIRRTDDDERIVYAEVYSPNTLDSHGEFMLAEDIKKMAHRFMTLNDLGTTIDTNHDNIPNGSYPIESFIARAGDPDFDEGAWVLGVKVPDDSIWRKIKDGTLNSYSFEAMVRPVNMEVTVRTVRDHVGVTRAEKGVDHDHSFFAQVNKAGKIVGGMTSPGPDGHVHEIKFASRTERSGANNHNHRFDLA